MMHKIPKYQIGCLIAKIGRVPQPSAPLTLLLLIAAAIMLQGKKIILVFVAYICLLSSMVVGFVTRFANNQPSAISYTHQTLSSHTQTSLFAKKNKKKPKRAAQTTKGFGAPPPKLEDVLATFKSRLPENAGENLFLLLSCVFLKLQLNSNHNI